MEIKTPNERLIEISCRFRGAIIHQYSYIDEVINGIVKFSAFNSSEEYYEYVKKRGGKISMDNKMELFKISIAKYEQKHNVNLTTLLDGVNRFKYVRDVMAHWLVKRDYDDIEHFKKIEGLITFYINKDLGFEKPLKQKIERFTKVKIERVLLDMKNSCNTIGLISKSIQNDFYNNNPDIQRPLEQDV